MAHIETRDQSIKKALQKKRAINQVNHFAMF